MEQRRIERRQAELVNAHRPCERVARHRFHELAAAGDDARLRAAEQLVAGEEHHVHARSGAFLGHRLVRQAERLRVQQAAAAQVVQHGNAAPAADLDQLGDGGRVGEAHHAEVAGVDEQQRTGVVADGVLEIACVGAVGGAHLHKLGAALLQDVRNAEPAADLHRLAARNDDLLSGCDGGEAQQHGGGVVVDDQGRLGAGQLAHVAGDGRLAGASPSGVEVQLQVAIARGGLPHRVRRGFAERCASQVGVQHHPGCVDYAAGRRSEARARESRDVAGHVIEAGRCAALVRDAPPGEREPIAHQVQHRATRVGARQRVHAAVAHHPVDAWQRPELRSHRCPRA